MHGCHTLQCVGGQADDDRDEYDGCQRSSYRRVSRRSPFLRPAQFLTCRRLGWLWGIKIFQREKNDNITRDSYLKELAFAIYDGERY